MNAQKNKELGTNSQQWSSSDRSLQSVSRSHFQALGIQRLPSSHMNSDQWHLVAFCFGFPGAVERRKACLCLLCVTKRKSSWQLRQFCQTSVTWSSALDCLGLLKGEKHVYAYSVWQNIKVPGNSDNSVRPVSLGVLLWVSWGCWEERCMLMLSLCDKTLKFLATQTILSDQCHLVFCFGLLGTVVRKEMCLICVSNVNVCITVSMLICAGK